MLRARWIKPGIVSNEDLCALGPFAYILFTGLWMLADREGRLEDRPKRIKAMVMGLWDEVCGKDVDNLLDALWKSGFIHRYVVSGSAHSGCDGHYIQIVNWCKHQHPHSREVVSTIPPSLTITPNVEQPATAAESVSSVRHYLGDAEAQPRRGRARLVTSYLLLEESGDRKTTDSSEENGSPAADKSQGKKHPENLPPAAAKTSTQVEAVSTQVAPVRKQPAREEQPSQDGPQRSEDLSILRQSLDSLASELQMPPPDDVILRSIFAAGHGATGMQIHEALVGLYHGQRFRSMRSWGLLPLVIAQCFGVQPRARAG